MRFQYALVTFLFALSSAERIARHNGLLIRQDNNDAAVTSDAPASSTNTEENPTSSPTPTESASRTNSDQDQGTKTASRTGDEASPITRTGTETNVPTSTPTPTLLTGDKNATDTNPLPIQPQINAPLSIAGVILMLSGLALGFVGIKHRATQIFLSTSLLIALAIEVLIVYLMKPPVPVGIQVAYMIAGLFGGILVGAAALLFKEMSEGFGCILGGFCFAMWILVLAPGGTITGSVGKIILIASFCIACYCLYISRFTRVYGIIFSTALAGATAVMLGLDCFTRAGLKEFWLYIWNLNDDIFPPETDTYPITRPIRAETAAIIIIAFLGSMSQVKIWKIVKEGRQNRENQRIQDEEARDADEELVGRRVEDENRGPLAQWEHNYDGKKMPDSQIHDSGRGSIDEDYSSVTTSHKNSHPMVHIRPATSEQNLSTVPQSSSTVNLLPQPTDTKNMPSLPEFGWMNLWPDETTGKTSFVSDNVKTPSERSAPATPGLDVPGGSIKDRRSVAMKRLSLQSLNEKAAMEAAEDKKAHTPEEEEEAAEPYGSELASSAGATAPDDRSAKLSIELDFDIYKSWASAPPSPAIVEEEQPVFEEDNDALGPQKRRSMLSMLSSNGRRQSSSSRRRTDAPPSPGLAKSDNGEAAGPVRLQEELLPKKGSRPAKYHRTREWAKEVSRAEPEPIEEIEMDDPEAVRIETADAAEAARAEENNAAPAPPAPPTPPPEPPKPAVVKDSKANNHVERSSVAMPTPIYSHKPNGSEDSWSVPLGKRSSSAQVLHTEPGSTPMDVMRNVSAPILEQPLVTSPIASPEPNMRTPSRNNRLSTVSPLPNLMDQRKDRMDKRLTSTSFMRPSTGLGIDTPPKTVSNDSKEGSLDGSQSRKVSVSTDPNQDEEDMTLAERKAMVQRQSQLQMQNAEMAPRPMGSRQASGYGFPEIRSPPRAARMSSQPGSAPLYDSHQPRRTSTHDVHKQNQLMHQWRTSQQAMGNSRNPYMMGDQQAEMLRAQHNQIEYEKKLQAQQAEALQLQMDTFARTGGLNNAHAKALARMQKKANEHAK